ncbi:hypothetical protein PCL_03179 [Purpureocillium lilacinum]|uniref:Uncharacterized protein n=1 Tax=Purpureocillium lilacinum TaxID=33203 RepID=A0A2U3DYS4_PURLI|nr:hypothetical protein Purlil1_621 [Purpureocillium lilacinum]PWI67411.1 hypothetical protein PCL_03179 [Purpureocillium lilacinum]
MRARLKMDRHLWSTYPYFQTPCRDGSRRPLSRNRHESQRESRNRRGARRGGRIWRKVRPEDGRARRRRIDDSWGQIRLGAREQEGGKDDGVEVTAGGWTESLWEVVVVAAAVRWLAGWMSGWTGSSAARVAGSACWGGRQTDGSRTGARPANLPPTLGKASSQSREPWGSPAQPSPAQCGAAQWAPPAPHRTELLAPARALHWPRPSPLNWIEAHGTPPGLAGGARGGLVVWTPLCSGLQQREMVAPLSASRCSSSQRGRTLAVTFLGIWLVGVVVLTSPRAGSRRAGPGWLGWAGLRTRLNEGEGLRVLPVVTGFSNWGAPPPSSTSRPAYPPPACLPACLLAHDGIPENWSAPPTLAQRRKPIAAPQGKGPRPSPPGKQIAGAPRICDPAICPPSEANRKSTTDRAVQPLQINPRGALSRVINASACCLALSLATVPPPPPPPPPPPDGRFASAAKSKPFGHRLAGAGRFAARDVDAAPGPRIANPVTNSTKLADLYYGARRRGQPGTSTDGPRSDCRGPHTRPTPKGGAFVTRAPAERLASLPIPRLDAAACRDHQPGAQDGSAKGLLRITTGTHTRANISSSQARMRPSSGPVLKSPWLGGSSGGGVLFRASPARIPIVSPGLFTRHPCLCLCLAPPASSRGFVAGAPSGPEGMGPVAAPPLLG